MFVVLRAFASFMRLSIVSVMFPGLADRIIRRYGRKPIAKGEAP